MIIISIYINIIITIGTMVIVFYTQNQYNYPNNYQIINIPLKAIYYQNIYFYLTNFVVIVVVSIINQYFHK